MSNSTDEVLENNDPSLQCNICCSVVRDPVECNNCKATFCRDCILPYLDSQDWCPSCTATLDREELPQPDALTNPATRVKCQFSDRGCLEHTTLEDYEIHLLQCEYRLSEETSDSWKPQPIAASTPERENEDMKVVSNEEDQLPSQEATNLEDLTNIQDDEELKVASMSQGEQVTAETDQMPQIQPELDERESVDEEVRSNQLESMLEKVIEEGIKPDETQTEQEHDGVTLSGNEVDPCSCESTEANPQNSTPLPNKEDDTEEFSIPSLVAVSEKSFIEDDTGEGLVELPGSSNDFVEASAGSTHDSQSVTSSEGHRKLSSSSGSEVVIITKDDLRKLKEDITQLKKETIEQNDNLNKKLDHVIQDLKTFMQEVREHLEEQKMDSVELKASLSQLQESHQLQTTHLTNEIVNVSKLNILSVRYTETIRAMYPLISEIKQQITIPNRVEQAFLCVDTRNFFSGPIKSHKPRVVSLVKVVRAMESRLRDGARVLVMGSCGYDAAVLSLLVGETGFVADQETTTSEVKVVTNTLLRDKPELVQSGLITVNQHARDIPYPEKAPYDAILNRYWQPAGVCKEKYLEALKPGGIVIYFILDHGWFAFCRNQQGQAEDVECDLKV